MVKTTPCKSCGADMVWLVTYAGKWIPVDAETVVSGEEIFDPDTHTSHFATCPEADRFRKSKKDKDA